ncbi:TRAP transporter large permease [Aminipila sp.]|uniref:TRAP transporter large permease n=1 Tax=Aminipila sp. TaxID=2060095 RepID=UPI0028983969|nr:TRAP transporter large permease [Aminipila sp.]
MEGLIIIAIFIVMLFINVPIAISLGIASFAYVLFLSPLPVDLVIQSYFSGVDSFPLLAVPFFILAGDLMMEGGISTRLIDFCSALMGKVVGALGMITVFASMIFAAISGSGPATVACVGGIMVPAMIKEKYDKSFACAIAAAAGALGPIIPPSISFIMYGVIAGLSITDLFIAGVIPGILMAIALMIFVHIVAKKKGYGMQDIQTDDMGTLISPKEKISIGKSFINAIWALMVPIIILGGIYGGIFTPTEAAIVASDYAILVSIFVYKELKFRDLPRIFAKTALTSGTVMILVACATAFGRLLTMEQVPTNIASFILGISDNKIIVLLLINIFLLFVGMLMETLAAIIILSPILLSVVTPLGVDPIHFGVIMVMNLVIGMCTPPVGVNTFVASRLGGIKIEEMFKWLYVAIGVLIIVLMVCTYVPAISTFLPNLLK